MPVSRRGQMMLSAINAYVTLDGYLGRIPLDQKVPPVSLEESDSQQTDRQTPRLSDGSECQRESASARIFVGVGSSSAARLQEVRLR